MFMLQPLIDWFFNRSKEAPSDLAVGTVRGILSLLGELTEAMKFVSESGMMKAKRILEGGSATTSKSTAFNLILFEGGKPTPCFFTKEAYEEYMIDVNARKLVLNTITCGDYELIWSKKSLIKDRGGRNALYRIGGGSEECARNPLSDFGTMDDDGVREAKKALDDAKARAKAAERESQHMVVTSLFYFRQLCTHYVSTKPYAVLRKNGGIDNIEDDDLCNEIMEKSSRGGLMM